MFLKTLSLKGFKSFASPTQLDFEQGVAVVVGPNGSGKSNVVDAIAWVLGAQRPSAVRSTKMDDVIFAGTSNRKALGRAEVSLTLDNSARLMPIEFEEVTITRRLFRTGESEYEINGVPCRLLDIQDLLSDSGVGRQQHVIISQGQIDAVLNARPEERRAIIEEAAGVLKYRRRKEKSERRLESTQVNLTRLQDLLREVRRQLKPLERQADAARRHGDLVGELTTLRIHLAGREIASLRERSAKSAEESQQFGKRQNELSSRLSELDESVRGAEQQLADAGADDMGSILGRCESLRERLRGVDAVLAERIRNIDSERQATADGAVVSALEADREQIQRELADVDARAALLVSEVTRVEDAEKALDTARDDFDKNWGNRDTNPVDETAKVRGELTAHTHNRQRLEAERSRLVAKSEELRTTSGVHTAEADSVRERLTQIERSEGELNAAFDQAQSASDKAVASNDQAVAAVDAAREARSTWQARVEALTMALEGIRAQSGVAELADVNGVLGPLLDLVDIDEGFEAALAAAIGDAAHGVVVEDLESAERAATALEASATSGVLLPVPTGTPPAAVANSLRSHVRGSTDQVNAILDAHLNDVVVLDEWTTAVRFAIDNSETLVVTTEGAALGPRGWRVGAERLAATGVALDEATAQAEVATEHFHTCTTTAQKTGDDLKSASKALAKVQAELNVCDDELVATAARLATIQRSTHDAQTESDQIVSRLGDIDQQLESDDQHLATLNERLAALEVDEEAKVEQLQLMQTDRGRLDEQAKLVAGMRSDIEVRTKAIADRRKFLTERGEDVEQRLGRHSVSQHDDPENRLAIANDLRVQLSGREAELDTWIESLRAQRQRQGEEVRAITGSLESARTERTATDKALRELRERQSTRQVEEAEINVRLEAAMETLRRDHDTEVGKALRTEAPPLPPGMTAANRLSELERELRIMGPINPLALEEFDTLSERHEFLQSQLDDVKDSRKELQKVIRAIDEEIVQVFASAYADVAENFTQLFSTLFPGGTGALRLTTPDELLNTGIEVEARPSGKNVRKLSLLSGGERSLTALAFLFAVFRSRPSPFYVMDEVEAALDDVNLHRFLSLVAEFRDEAQLIIVSHQKRTMEAADCLYGVSVKPGDGSRIVSERPGADMSEYLDPVAATPDNEPAPV